MNWPVISLFIFTFLSLTVVSYTSIMGQAVLNRKLDQVRMTHLKIMEELTECVEDLDNRISYFETEGPTQMMVEPKKVEVIN